MITKTDILAATDIDSDRTLIRWHKAGLIPPPEVSPGPGGRGRTGRWPNWVLQRCVRIRQLVEQGWTLEKIAETLGQDWEEEERRWKRQRRTYRMSEVGPELDYQASVRNLSEMVGEKLEPLLVGVGADARKAFAGLDRTLFRKKTIDLAIGLVRDGFNPLLVYDGKKWSITPDFVVSQLTGQSGERATALLTVSIHSEVVTAFSSIFDGLPDKPYMSPVPRVAIRKEGEVVERKVNRVGKWDFEIAGET